MTTRTKLSIGFGALIVLLIISNAGVILPLQAVDGEITAMAEVGRPRRAATRALEVGVLSFSLAVRTYTHSYDPIHQKEADEAARDVEAQHAVYLGLSENDRQREMAEHFLLLWREHKERGSAITHGPARAYTAQELQRLMDSRVAVMNLLRKGMLPDALESYENQKKIALANVAAIQRNVVILFILCLFLAVVMSRTIGRAVVRSEKEIQSRREHLRATLTSIADAVVTTDTDGNVTSMNTAAENLTGSSQAEAVGKQLVTVVNFIDKMTGAAVESPALQALRDGTFVDPDGVLLATQYGTKVPIEDHASPILNPKGDVIGTVLVFRDITERKLHEQEMREIQEELELRVSHRTFELAETNTKLINEMQSHAIAERNRIELLGRLVTSQESERRRIARDLHDQLGQRLTALRLKISSLKDGVSDDEVLTLKVERLQEIALRLDSEVSYMAWELRPTALDDLGFRAALGAFVREWSRHFEIPADFQAAEIPKERLDPQIEIHLYRIAQEALNNVAKHAEAKQVSVVLEKRGERLILIIEDDGKGFVAEEVSIADRPGGGLGLLGMQERATLIGGDVEIESAPGSGTTIYVRATLARSQKDTTEWAKN